MEWPAQSPDFNPIENWKRCPQNDLELFEILKSDWNSLDINILENLVDSMAKRCKLVIESNGMPIKN